MNQIIPMAVKQLDIWLFIADSKPFDQEEGVRSKSVKLKPNGASSDIG